MATTAHEASVPCQLQRGTEAIELGFQNVNGKFFYSHESFDNSEEDRELIREAASLALEGAHAIIDRTQISEGISKLEEAQDTVGILSPYTRLEFANHAIGLLAMTGYLRKSRKQAPLIRVDDMRGFIDESNTAIRQANESDCLLGPTAVDAKLASAYGELLGGSRVVAHGLVRDASIQRHRLSNFDGKNDWTTVANQRIQATRALTLERDLDRQGRPLIQAAIANIAYRSYNLETSAGQAQAALNMAPAAASR